MLFIPREFPSRRKAPVLQDVTKEAKTLISRAENVMQQVGIIELQPENQHKKEVEDLLSKVEEIKEELRRIEKGVEDGISSSTNTIQDQIDQLREDIRKLMEMGDLPDGVVVDHDACTFVSLADSKLMGRQFVENLRQILSWLDRGVCRIGVHGAGGVGKTTFVTHVHDTMDWYAGNVANYESYINAAFRSRYRENEAYIFMKDEYLRLNYAPGTIHDKVVNGPLLICDGFPSLAGTAFAEYGIDCAFGSHDKNEAFIFSGNLCAQINFAPGTTNDYIIKGPMTITAMFPFFNGTVFESSIDAAFEATIKYEAYLFKDNHYALINYGSSSHGIAIRIINQGFPSLKNTIFESGIDAAFASHRTDEAYLFKGDSYARINFAPHTTNDYIIGGVKKILPYWPSLRSILPRKNRGLGFHDHTEPNARCYDHDEL